MIMAMPCTEPIVKTNRPAAYHAKRPRHKKTDAAYDTSVCFARTWLPGSMLIFTGLRYIGWKSVLVFFILGLSAIYAAHQYTIGKNPYGYLGLGDIFVFIYSGLSVCRYLFPACEFFDPLILLPASAIGLLSSGVLNLNNMRDLENDCRSGKRTLVVHIGTRAAKIYHLILISLSIVFS